MPLLIREASIEDAVTVKAITNWYIQHTSINFDQDIWSLEKRIKWLEPLTNQKSSYKLFIGEKNGEIVGFSYNSPFKPKPSYNKSTETSLYCAPDKTSKGHGNKLYTALMSFLCEQNFHRAYAFISLPNEHSIKLHQNHGYHLVGKLNQVGYKFDKFHVSRCMKKILNSILY